MIYLLFIISLVFNGILIWYIRNLLTKYWYDVEARNSFVQMLKQYEEALSQIYKLEEFYGEETLKKAIAQTKFVVQACEEFKEILEKNTLEQAESEEDEEENDYQIEENQKNKKEAVIRLKEGESVTQDASSYKRVIPDKG